MATMKEVAVRAGVSTSTVSHVINNTRPVRDDVRKRVLAIIDELRYVPSAVARSLKNDRTRVIGVVIPDNTSHCRAELICGIEEAACEAGYNILLCNGSDEPRKQSFHLRALIEKRIDGVVLVEEGVPADLQALLGAQAALPVVLVDHDGEHDGADVVGLDYEMAGYMAGRHLAGLGHRELAFIGVERRCSQRQLAGFRRAAGAAGIVLRPECVLETEPGCAGGSVALGRLLGLARRPTGVFAANDLLALGALSAAAEAGVSVPRQLSVVGCDGIEPAAWSVPRLTTIAQPQRALGRLVAETLMGRIGTLQRQPRRQLLPGELVVRHSSAPPA